MLIKDDFVIIRSDPEIMGIIKAIRTNKATVIFYLKDRNHNIYQTYELEVNLSDLIKIRFLPSKAGKAYRKIKKEQEIKVDSERFKDICLF